MTPQTRQGSGRDWDNARKAALFADIVSLKLSIDEAALLHGLRVDVIQEWLRQFRRSALLAFDERLKKTLIEQGANADALTAAEFTGHVEDVSIADLVQTIEIAGKDAVITVTHEGTDSRMWCSAGAIVDAESGRLSGEAAVYRILSFERGRMVADLRPEQRSRTIYAATHRLLIEALRRKDESQKLEQRLGNINRLYRLGERSTSSRVRVSTDELSILRLFDGPRRLREVLAQSHIGDLETLTALVRLVDDGYLVEADGAAALRDNRQSMRSSVPRPAKTERLESAQQVDVLRRAGEARKEAANEIKGGKARTPADGDVEHASKGCAQPEPPHPGERSPSEPSRTENGRQGPERATAGDTNRDDGADLTSSASSFAPTSASREPERTTMPRWMFAALAAAVLAPAAFWFGETMSNQRSGRRAGARSEQTDRAALEAAPSFSIRTHIEPSSAEIWLDRHPVATGQLDLVLPKDGKTHELRVAAEGFIPVTLLFADVPPPQEIRLEAMPTYDGSSARARVAPATERSAAPARQLPAPEAKLAPEAQAAPEATPAPEARPAPAPSGGHRDDGARRSSGDEGASGADAPPAAPQIIELSPRDEPRVQIIEEAAPMVKVIE